MTHALYEAARQTALGYALPPRERSETETAMRQSMVRAVPEMPFLHPLPAYREARRVILGQRHALGWQIDFALHKILHEDRRLERAPP